MKYKKLLNNYQISQFICDISFSLSETNYQSEKTERYIDFINQLDENYETKQKLLLKALYKQIKITLQFVMSKTNWNYLETKERIAKCLNNSINRVDIETTHKAFELYENRYNYSL